MKNTLKTLFLILGAALFGALPGNAQTLLLPTTFAAAVTSGSTRTYVVTSAGTGASACIVGNVIYADRELAYITAAPTTTTLIMQRGASGTTAVPHASGDLLQCGAPNSFGPSGNTRVDPQGSPEGACTRANLLTLPFFNVKYGTVADCLGGHWLSGVPFNGGTATASRFRVESSPSGGTAYTSLNTNGTAVGATTLYCTEVWLPANKLLTGIAVLNGTTVTANARYVILYDSAGNALVNSALAGAASVTASIYESFAFTAKYFAIGPAQYFGCIQDNAVGSTTVRMLVTGTQDNTLTKGQTSAVFGTVPALVVPTTFTTAVGPYIYLY
ncbi:MAG: hypothetical protein V4522_13190 [Pseudomonadota bacterium]